MQTCDEPLNVSLALVPRTRERLAMILRCEMRRQQADRRQRHRTLSHQLENDWKATSRPRRFDTVVRRVLGQMKSLRTVREQRRKAFAQIQPTRVELHQKRDQMRDGMPFRLDGALDVRQQVAIGELAESRRRDGYHAPGYTIVVSCGQRCPTACDHRGEHLRRDSGDERAAQGDGEGAQLV